MGRLRSPLAEADLALLPGLLAAALFVVWAVLEGGFPDTVWYPGGLLLLGLSVAVAFGLKGRIPRLSRLELVAIALFAAFAIWSFVSIAWAGVADIAWDGANRTLVYLLVYTLFALLAWRYRSAALLLGAYSLALAGVGLVLLVGIAGSDDAILSFISGRLVEPTGYANATAALFIGGFWPAVYLAGRRQTPIVLRGALLGAAGLLVQIALVPQSRGSLLVLPIALAIFIAIVPGRVRLLLSLAAVGGATALVSGPILDVFTVARDGSAVGDEVSAATEAMVVSFVGLVGVGIAAALLDTRLTVGERWTRRGERGTAVALVATVVVALAAGLVAVGDPIAWAGERVEDFKSGYDSAGFGSSRFSGDLGSNRYDFWRVSMDEIAPAEPVAGDGADNFATPYLRSRESDEEPLYPHSLPVRVIAGTGVVGGSLLGGSLIAMVLLAVRVRRFGAGEPERGIAAVALAAFAYWFGHSGADWLWSFPALTAPVFAWLGIAASLGRSSGGSAASANPGRGRLLAGSPAVAAAMALAAAAFVSLLLPWAAARDVQVAADTWRADPDAAYNRLDRARSVNPTSARADLTAGTIASVHGDFERGLSAFDRALEREPNNWYALLQLGTLRAAMGEEGAAAAIARARELNPLDPLPRTALRRLRAERPLSPVAINDAFLERVCSVVGRTEETSYCEE